jgi:hypothetical protein
MSRRWGTALSFLFFIVTASCDRWLRHSCTDVGCRSGVTVTVRPVAGTFPPGSHEVDIIAGSDPVVRCTFELSDNRSPNVGVTGVCTGNAVSVSVSPRSACTETVTDNARSLSCVPIPGQYEEVLTIDGTPSSVRILQRTSASTIIDRELAPTYKDTRPNGPDCDPLCHQATAEWEL